MPQMTFDTANKSKSVFNTELLKGLIKGDKARICIIDRTVNWIFAHSVITLSDDGKSKKFRYYKCLGDYAKVQAEGKDKEGCPACAVAQSGEDATVKLPRRRFIVYILRYTTNSDGKVLKPLSFRLQAWVFNDQMYNRITDFAEEYGDMREHDIIVSCENQQFQNYALMATPDAEWKKQGRVDEVKECLKGRSPEIELLLGAVVSHEKLESAVGEALPSALGPTDTTEQRASRAVNSAFDGLRSVKTELDDDEEDSTPDPAVSVVTGEGEESDIAFARNDREPVGVAARGPAEVSGKVSIDELL